MRGIRILAAILAAALVLGVPTLGQDTSDTSPPTMDSIARSLQRIVELLEMQVGNQRAGLAVQRLDIARRELVARERELHEAEQTRDRYRQQMDELESRKEAYGSSVPEDSGMTEEQFDYMRRQLELDIEASKQGAWRADQRIVDLQNEIRRVREDLDVWEALVAESFRD